MAAKALSAVTEEDVEPIEGDTSKHVLVLGDSVFACADKLPITTIVRYANSGLGSMHHVLVRLVSPEDHERMWDAFEALDEDEAMAAYSELIASYSDRPTRRASSSRGGSKRTGH